jgi:hypothetical protein
MKLSNFEPIKKDYGSGTQIVLDFGKYHLSVITGGYGHAEAPYEIAVFNANDGVAGAFVQLAGITGPDDDVRGYMTNDEVDAIIMKMFVITGKQPVQV